MLAQDIQVTIACLKHSFFNSQIKIPVRDIALAKAYNQQWASKCIRYHGSINRRDENWSLNTLGTWIQNMGYGSISGLWTLGSFFYSNLGWDPSMDLNKIRIWTQAWTLIWAMVQVHYWAGALSFQINSEFGSNSNLLRFFFSFLLLKENKLKNERTRYMLTVNG